MYSMYDERAEKGGWYGCHPLYQRTWHFATSHRIMKQRVGGFGYGQFWLGAGAVFCFALKMVYCAGLLCPAALSWRGASKLPTTPLVRPLRVYDIRAGVLPAITPVCVHVCFSLLRRYTLLARPPYPSVAGILCMYLPTAYASCWFCMLPTLLRGRALLSSYYQHQRVTSTSLLASCKLPDQMELPRFAEWA